MAVKIDRDICIGCGNCEAACPQSAIVMEDGYPAVTDKCISCGICINGCPVEAISAEAKAVHNNKSGGVLVHNILLT